MFKIIILTAFRSLIKYKHISLINLFGLVVGLTSFLFSVYYVVYEYSFDSFFDQSENIYRINYEVTKQGEILYKGAKSPRGLFHAIKEEIPEVEANGCAYFEKCQVLFEDTYYANQDFLWVSEDFERVFPLEMIEGVADYSAPRLGIISETSAKALFHDTDPVGSIMEVNGEMPMKNKDLGIELNGVLLCTGPASLNSDPQKRQKYQAFKNEILHFAGIESVTFNMFVPGMEPPGYSQREFHNPEQGVPTGAVFYENNTDEGFINTYKIKLLAGNNFGIARDQNINDVIINQSAVQQLGFENPEEAIGRWIFRRGDTTRYEVIGVVNDFHNEGLQKPIYPIVWNNDYPREFGYFAIRVNTKSIQETLSHLKSIWGRHYTKDELDYVFADHQFNAQYESESRYSKFYVWLTFLSIAIANIGLYGLIVFYLSKRNKEIGVRKVNGASVLQVVKLFNRDFLSRVIIAFCIACPVAWFAMQNWLADYAFKTGLSWWIFGLAGFLVLGIALLTVSLQSWKAATRNPVEALRYE